MRVLVTGAAGFIGSNVRKSLEAAGHEVIALDLLLEAVHGPNAQPPQGVSRIDLRDTDKVEPLLSGVDTVCHFAAVTAPKGATEFAQHNEVGTAVLLDAMARAKVRHLVLASSVAVYGEGRYRGTRGGQFFPGLRRRADLDRGLFDHRAPHTGEVLTWEPVGEDAPLRPRGFYATSKLAQENHALAWGLATGAAVTALRLPNVYGEGARAGWVGQFRAALDAGKGPHVFEDGGQVRDFLHIDDAASATVAAVDRRLPGFVPLNIATGRPITLWEVASLMAKARSAPTPIVTGQYNLADVRHIVPDPERARRALEFTAATTPTQGLPAFATPAPAPS
ncbi:NAD-dependent epimerase/dehydratase family protein [Nocardia sp. NPDC052566]|uniref:NAD-dependent epimerase/dehydratase family protein n=1 Tax=Nocardia sp. NPDC052566 TaxID=3364330 RepID=UPI0037C923A9